MKQHYLRPLAATHTRHNQQFNQNWAINVYNTPQSQNNIEWDDCIIVLWNKDTYTTSLLFTIQDSIL